ncbi:TolC family protein, partial [uncultured Parasutterella sp.]
NFIKHYQTLVEPNWIAGIGVNFTLWDAKDRRASIRSAEATVRQAEAGKAEAINQVRTGVEVAWLKTKNAIEQYKLSASTVKLASENLRLKSKSFGEGLATALDVNEARNQLLQAEVGRRLAAFEFVSNYAMLHAIAGQMSEFMNAVNNRQVIIEQ